MSAVRVGRSAVRVGFVSLALLLLAGCGGAKQNEYGNDAPRTGAVDESAAMIITMPDGFTNVATKCVQGGNRLFVAFHGDGAYGAIFVVPDSTCAK